MGDPGDRRYRPTTPEASPLLAPDLTGLCPTLLVTADHDLLRDEGRAYAARLAEAGNTVSFHEWPGTTHGFMIMAGSHPRAGTDRGDGGVGERGVGVIHRVLSAPPRPTLRIRGRSHPRHIRL